MNRTSVLDGVDAEFSNQSFMFQRLLISTKLIVHTLLHRSKLKCSSFSCQLANIRYCFVFVYDFSILITGVLAHRLTSLLEFTGLPAYCLTILPS